MSSFKGQLKRNDKSKNKRTFDFGKSKQTFRIFIICSCVVFIVAVSGSFLATWQHNQAVVSIKANSGQTYGLVVPLPPNSKVIKTNYEFEYNGKKYWGSTYGDIHFSEGSGICINFNKNDPNENVYYGENEIIEMNYISYSIKVVGAFIIILFLIFSWSFLTGNKKLIA